MPVTWDQARAERDRIMNAYTGVECIVFTDDEFLSGEWGLIIHDVRPSEKKTTTQLALFGSSPPDSRFPAFSFPTAVGQTSTAYP